jgi:hypothetical protein
MAAPTLPTAAPAAAPDTATSPAAPAASPRWWRAALRRGVTVLAALLVLACLVIPDALGALAPAAFVSVPVEALLGVVAVLLLPARARTAAAVVAGALVGLVTIVKLLDLGFGTALGRPFDLLGDWPLLRAAREFLAESFGDGGARAATVSVVTLAVAIPVLAALSALRLARVVARRRAAAGRAVAVLAAAWVVLAVTGAHVVPGVPLAARHTVGAAYDHTAQAAGEIAARRAFARALPVDAYRDVPAASLLTGLRGKDVLVTFIESYGRDAIEDPELAPQVDALLATGSARLDRAGFETRSGFLTSSTTGGGSWLAHATLQSGLWVDSQRRYDEFTGSDRFTLTAAFERAGWRTVAVMPANKRDWPEGAVYGYDKVYDAPALGYRGPGFAFSSPPDQFTLSAFHRAERARAGHQPVLAQLDLLSSHAPWRPIPPVLGWDDIGDGSGYPKPTESGASPSSVNGRDVASVRADYRRSVEYSVESVISYVERYGDDDLVVLLLGDHQASPLITGSPDASRDVPVTVIAKDPAVTARIAGWGWQPGLNPGPDAPVWPMDAFRDRFLGAFS